MTTFEQERVHVLPSNFLDLAAALRTNNIAGLDLGFDNSENSRVVEGMEVDKYTVREFANGGTQVRRKAALHLRNFYRGFSQVELSLTRRLGKDAPLALQRRGISMSLYGVHSYGVLGDRNQDTPSHILDLQTGWMDFPVNDHFLLKTWFDERRQPQSLYVREVGSGFVYRCEDFTGRDEFTELLHAQAAVLNDALGKNGQSSGRKLDVFGTAEALWNGEVELNPTGRLYRPKIKFV